MSDEKKRDDYAIQMPLMDRESRAFDPPLTPRQPPHVPIVSSPVLAILSYCGSSILMTVTNKYVLSGVDFNLNFFLLAVQV
jgi:GDP-mannose transporter